MLSSDVVGENNSVNFFDEMVGEARKWFGCVSTDPTENHFEGEDAQVTGTELRGSK